MKAFCKYILCPLFVIIPFFVEASPYGEENMGGEKPGSFFVSSKDSAKLVYGKIIEKIKTEISVKGFSKLGSSIGLTDFMVISPSKIRPDTSENQEADESVESQFDILIWFIIIVLFPLYYASSKSI